MPKEMIVKDKQNIFDITIEGYGQLDNLIDILRDNNLTLSGPLSSGLEISIDSTKGDNEIKKKLLLQGLGTSKLIIANEQYVP